ncbi:conserved hypothetical protein [Luminiphilus syltensis NOR5-1B]|uniref:DUF4412 domain-containing protein n=1 Tax=Luminiphilus syltensis NOR5-1B TaxID=565045 RepID=B8KV66_9GAMM|nr:hypothetical protein [Luminiphilus syltensis]EED35690.1 conserved hypothetical protein [Luminiphilus syltensis NOR5-1B]
MKKRSVVTSIFGPLVASSLFATVTVAGIATIESSDGGETTLEYNETMLRINSAESTDAYMVVRDGNMYSVVDTGDGMMVMDAGAMMKQLGNSGMLPTDWNSDLAGELLSFEDTGKKETVAGIRGDVYEARFRDEDGEERLETLVLSSDPRVQEYTQAMGQMMAFATSIAPEASREKSDDFMQRLTAMDAGVLRFGDDMRVSTISGETVPADRFELPAEPTDMSGLSGLLGKLSTTEAADSEGESSTEPEEEEKGGLFSSVMGVLGAKTERQKDRVEDQVDETVDEETDKATDSVIDKALGTLFGK